MLNLPIWCFIAQFDDKIGLSWIQLRDFISKASVILLVFSWLFGEIFFTTSQNV